MSSATHKPHKFVQKGAETYYGPIIRDTYNGYGQYIANNALGESWSYEGMFYCNNFHGYGTLSYSDGSTFSGLYKHGKQFGPGVFTYPDGKQDVGIWFGSQLLRLTVPVDRVEKLCHNSKDKIQCTLYKKLVPLPIEEEKDVATEILTEAGAEGTRVMDHSRKLYSRHCKNPKSYLFDHKLFKDYKNHRITDLRDALEDLFILGNNDKTDPATYVNIEHIRLNEKEVKKPEEEDENVHVNLNLKSKHSKLTEENNAKYLLTWNNQDIVIELMLHSFNYRRQECVSNYDIGDILCNRRKCFNACGVKEDACIQMLEASSNNDAKTILKLITQLHLNPNVMDNKGNSMILIAAELSKSILRHMISPPNRQIQANDCELVIHILGELKADLNAVNDEGFNALNHTLTRYIAVKEDVTDWPSAFLLPSNQASDERQSIKEWMTLSSSLTSLPIKQSAKATLSQTTRKSSLKKQKVDMKLRYIFDLTPSPPEVGKVYSDDLELSKMDEEASQITTSVKLAKTNRLKKIERTFHALLDAGADIHGSKAPLPLLTLALFTRSPSIVEGMLKHGVDPNSIIKLEEGQLYPLHIMALISPSIGILEIVNLLLKHGADPLMKTDENYRMQRWSFLLNFGRQEKNKKTITTSNGMTPLHALILRPDAEYVHNKEILSDLCCMLSWCTGQELFHGLTPFGLAVAVNSLRLASIVYACSDADINHKYDYFWGNPLTTFMITHGCDPDYGSPMLKFLIKNGAHPLVMKGFSEFENVMNFLENYKHNYTDNFFTRDKTKSFKSNVSSLSKLQEFEKKEHILRKVGRQRVEDHLKGVLVRSLLYCMQNTAEDEPELAEILPLVIKSIKTWIEPEELLHLFKANLRSPEYSNGVGLISAAMAFINFTDLFQKEIMKPSDLLQFIKNVQTPKENEGPILPSEQDFTNFINKEIKTKAEKFHKYQIKPAEIDKDGKMYMVCYHCLKRSKDLFLCPVCELVHFCSTHCAKIPADPKSKHKCKIEAFMLSKKTVEKLSGFSDLRGDDKELGDYYKKRNKTISCLQSRRKLSKEQRIKKKGKEKEEEEVEEEIKDKKIKKKKGKEKEEEEEEEEIKDKKTKKKKTQERKGKHKSNLSSKSTKGDHFDEDYKKKRSSESKEEARKVFEKSDELSSPQKLSLSRKRIKSKTVSMKHERSIKLSQKEKAFERHSKIKINKIRKSKQLKEMECIYTREKGTRCLFPASPFLTELLKRVQQFGWRESLLSSMHSIKWHLSSDSGSSSPSTSYLQKDLIKGTVCPAVIYNVLGGRAMPYEVCQEHESAYKFSLEERLKAFLLTLDLDFEKLFPFLVYIPNVGTVYYKSYPECFENFSFN